MRHSLSLLHLDQPLVSTCRLLASSSFSRALQTWDASAIPVASTQSVPAACGATEEAVPGHLSIRGNTYISDEGYKLGRTQVASSLTAVYSCQPSTWALGCIPHVSHSHYPTYHPAQPSPHLPHHPYSTYTASTLPPQDGDYATDPSFDPYSASDPGSQPPQQPSETELLNQLLDTALEKHVPRHGWTHAALVAAAHELGLSPAAVGLIPLGEGALVLRLGENFTARLARELRNPERSTQLAALPLEARIAAALQLRLRMLVPHLDSWPQAMAVLARPSVAPAAVEALGRMVDEIWHAVGDRSIDSSWYTKRALLFSVYYSMELYMLTDYSPDFADTWAALDRRLHDTMRIFNAVHGKGPTRGPGMPGPGLAALNNIVDSAKAVLGALQPPPGPWDALLPRRA